MKGRWLVVLGALAVLALGVVLASCTTVNTTPYQGSGQQQGIWVSGEGKVTVVPDVAILRVGIEAQETSVAQAQTRANDAMNKVMTALTGNSVAGKDIQTQQFSIQKITRFDPDKQQEVLIGYRVTNIVSARIRVLPQESFTLDYKAGTIIDAVAAAGGDLTRIDSISFTVDSPETFLGEAREKAMNDAKAKARQLADLGGVTLGKPTYIAESGQLPPPIPVRFAEAKEGMALATPISPGEMEITLSVQVVYEIGK